MAVEGVGLEALTPRGGQIRRSRRLMVSIDTYPQRAVADGGEAGREAPAVGVQLLGREARSMVEARGAEARRGREDRGW